MFGLQVLDVALGLIFVYLLLSIICTAVIEMISGWMRLRATNLAEGIRNLLSDEKLKNLMVDFYKHPLIKSLSKEGEQPSYIPPRTFTLAFLDILAPAKPDAPLTSSEIRKKIESLDPNSDIRRMLLVHLDEVQDDMEKLRKSIETWFNNAMDRVSGWYKRRTQVIILGLAIIVTALANADTIEMAKALSNDPLLRQAVVAQAQEFAKQQERPGLMQEKAVSGDKTSVSASETKQPSEHLASAPTRTQVTTEGTKQQSSSEMIKASIDQLQGLGIPLGWKKQPQGSEWPNKIIGLLLTAIAVSMGAPFWFDLLQKFSKIRAAGAAPTEHPKETEAKENMGK